MFFLLEPVPVPYPQSVACVGCVLQLSDAATSLSAVGSGGMSPRSYYWIISVNKGTHVMRVHIIIATYMNIHLCMRIRYCYIATYFKSTLMTQTDQKFFSKGLIILITLK